MENNDKVFVNQRFVSVVKLLVELNYVKTIKDMCASIGLHQQVLSDIRTNKRSVTIEMLSILLNKYNINPTYILVGTGKMFLNETLQIKNIKSTYESTYEPKKSNETPQISNITKNTAVYKNLNETPQINKPQTIPETILETILDTEKSNETPQIIKIEEEGRTIPVLEVYAAAGSGYYNQEPPESTTSIQLPYHFLKKGQYICIRVKGASMAPTLQDSSYLIVRQIE